MKNIRLGDVLIEFGYITPDQLNTALAYQKEHRDLRVGQALQELGYVNERQVLEALAQRLQLKMIDIEHTNVDVTAVEKVPQELAQKYDMLPIAQSPRALTIAANDPLNYYALEDIRQLTGLEPEIVLAELEPLRRAIRYYYAEVSARKAAHATTSQPSQPNAAVNAPHTAATTALPLTNRFRFSIKHPSIRFCTVRHPPARGPGRLPKPRPHRPG